VSSGNKLELRLYYSQATKCTTPYAQFIHTCIVIGVQAATSWACSQCVLLSHHCCTHWAWLLRQQFIRTKQVTLTTKQKFTCTEEQQIYPLTFCFKFTALLGGKTQTKTTTKTTTKNMEVTKIPEHSVLNHHSQHGNVSAQQTQWAPISPSP
jgi:hypothetical protein